MRSVCLSIAVLSLGLWVAGGAAAAPKGVPALVPDSAELEKPCANADLTFASPAIRERFYSEPENHTFLFFWVKDAYKARFDEGYCTDWNLGITSWQKAHGNRLTGKFGLAELNQLLVARGLSPVSEDAIRPKLAASPPRDGIATVVETPPSPPSLIPRSNELAKPCQNAGLGFTDEQSLNRFNRRRDEFSSLLMGWASEAYGRRVNASACKDWRLAVMEWQRTMANPVTGMLSSNDLDSLERFMPSIGAVASVSEARRSAQRSDPGTPAESSCDKDGSACQEKGLAGRAGARKQISWGLESIAMGTSFERVSAQAPTAVCRNESRYIFCTKASAPCSTQESRLQATQDAIKKLDGDVKVRAMLSFGWMSKGKARPVGPTPQELEKARELDADRQMLVESVAKCQRDFAGTPAALTQIFFAGQELESATLEFSGGKLTSLSFHPLGGGSEALNKWLTLRIGEPRVLETTREVSVASQYGFQTNSSSSSEYVWRGRGVRVQSKNGLYEIDALPSN